MCPVDRQMPKWTYRICLCFTRNFTATEAGPPEDVKQAFKKYARGDTQMTEEQLRQFLVEAQGAVRDDATSQANHAFDQILKRHHLPRPLLTRHGLTLEDFHWYLFSADLNPPITGKINQDMKSPLSHYFIFTGHNSYLTGNQLTSDCSDVPVIKALKKGVRGIELDIWPNAKGNDVVVKHGGTATQPVKLIKCLQSIKKHAFSTSTYPVIITLEDHLNHELREKVAQMLKETFGKSLFYPKSGSLGEFPSPEKLKERIIISTKPPKKIQEACKDEGNGLQGGKDSSVEDVWGQEPSSLSADQEDDDSNEGESEDDECDLEGSQQPEYRDLICIEAGKPKGGMTKALEVEPGKVRRLSLSEQALEKAAKSHGEDVVRFTQKNILRVYPKGTRFLSSNYNPQIGWSHGAQMVAFNMQGYGRSLWLMQGMFRGNGGCGYVKKPDFLMNSNHVFNPGRKSPVAKKILKVKIYMGDGWHMDFKQTHFDLYSPPDFYVKVGIAGARADQSETMEQTKTKNDNWHPVWDQEFSFKLTYPELALLRIEVHESDYCTRKDDFGGQTCLPVSELRPGIRAVPLFNRKGEKLNSTRLLMRFTLETLD